eukprot:698209-Pyramimonas_sp.AAC.1
MLARSWGSGLMARARWSLERNSFGNICNQLRRAFSSQRCTRLRASEPNTNHMYYDLDASEYD